VVLVWEVAPPVTLRHTQLVQMVAMATTLILTTTQQLAQEQAVAILVVVVVVVVLRHPVALHLVPTVELAALAVVERAAVLVVVQQRLQTLVAVVEELETNRVGRLVALALTEFLLLNLFTALPLTNC
jgi:hypothetical protein